MKLSKAGPNSLRDCSILGAMYLMKSVQKNITKVTYACILTMTG